MGRSRRPRPKFLAEKLRMIRRHLDLSLTEMIERLGYTDSPLTPSDMSKYENDKKEPPTQLVLRYARITGIPMEVLVDDKMELPEKFRGTTS